MALLKIQLLGRFELQTAAHEPIRLGRKLQGLTALLAHSPGVRHARTQLAALLWGDVGDERARASLRQALSTLRMALGTAGDALGAKGDHVGFYAEQIEVDAVELEKCLG